MTRKSKREIQREIEDLGENDGDDGVGLTLGLTSIRSDKLEDSPHPELTVEAWPDSDRHDELKIAAPGLWPEHLVDESIIIIESCENGVTGTWPEEPGESDSRVRACKLWEGLADDDLRREYKIRQENGDPIPEMLEDYAPKE